MTNPQHEALVEAVARAIYDASHAGMSNCYAWDDRWEDHQESRRPRYYKEARAAIAALSATAATPSDEEVRLRAENAALRSDANAVIAYFDRKGVLRDAPGHSHSIAGIWDPDNEPGKAGMSCEWCAQWSAFRARAALEPPAKDV